jgi:hypothetical protein
MNYTSGTLKEGHRGGLRGFPPLNGDLNNALPKKQIPISNGPLKRSTQKAIF